MTGTSGPLPHAELAVLWPALRELRLKQERQGLHFWTVRDGSLPLEAAGLFHPGVCLRAFLPSSGSKTHLGLLPVHPCLVSVNGGQASEDFSAG